MSCRMDREHPPSLLLSQYLNFRPSLMVLLHLQQLWETVRLFSSSRHMTRVTILIHFGERFMVPDLLIISLLARGIALQDKLETAFGLLHHRILQMVPFGPTVLVRGRILLLKISMPEVLLQDI